MNKEVQQDHKITKVKVCTLTLWTNLDSLKNINFGLPSLKDILISLSNDLSFR